MTIDNNLGTEKIELDKDRLMRAYIELDQLFIRNDGSDYKLHTVLNNILFSIEMATGFQYFRTLKKIDTKKKENDNKK